MLYGLSHPGALTLPYSFLNLEWLQLFRVRMPSNFLNQFPSNGHSVVSITWMQGNRVLTSLHRRAPSSLVPFQSRVVFHCVACTMMFNQPHTAGRLGVFPALCYWMQGSDEQPLTCLIFW